MLQSYRIKSVGTQLAHESNKFLRQAVVAGGSRGRPYCSPLLATSGCPAVALQFLPSQPPAKLLKHKPLTRCELELAATKSSLSAS